MKQAGLVISQIFSSRTVQVVLGVIVIIAVIYFVGKSSGKKKAKKQAKNDLIADPSNLSGQDINDVSAIVDRVKKDIYSTNPLSRDIEAYQLLNVLGDNQLKQAHNDWLTKYYDLDGETIKVAISKEKDYSELPVLWFVAISDKGFAKVRDTLVARFDKLGL